MTTTLTAPAPDTDPRIQSVPPPQTEQPEAPDKDYGQLISFDLYIIVAEAVYHMEAAPSTLFQVWIEGVITEHEQPAPVREAYAALRDDGWPTSARWRTISDLAESGVILPLYASQAQAERVLQAQIEGKSEQQGEDHE
jgi:hypothetical protein